MDNDTIIAAAKAIADTLSRQLEDADEGERHFEVRALHTKSSAPFTFWID